MFAREVWSRQRRICAVVAPTAPQTKAGNNCLGQWQAGGFGTAPLFFRPIGLDPGRSNPSGRGSPFSTVVMELYRSGYIP
jgi:hypothetical protein